MRIPLFPLDLVLFPGQTLPMHIYELRYKAMLQYCLAEQAPFGIVLVRESGRFGRGNSHSVGTTARVVQVEEVPEGRCVVPGPHTGTCFHISCAGKERFRVLSTDRRAAEYLVGEIELYPDEAAPSPALAMVAERVYVLFDEYYRGLVALMGGWQRQVGPGEHTVMFDTALLMNGQSRLPGSEPGSDGGTRTITVPVLPDDPAVLANIVAAELNVPPEIKQELLETPSSLARLQRTAEILAEETPQLQERLKLQIRRRYGAFGMSS